MTGFVEASMAALLAQKVTQSLTTLVWVIAKQERQHPELENSQPHHRQVQDCLYQL